MRPTNRTSRPPRASSCAALVGALLLSQLPARAVPPTAHSEQGYDLSGYDFSTELLLPEAGATHAVVGPGTQDFDTQLYLVLDDQEVLFTLDADGTLSPLADLAGIHDGPSLPPTFDVMGLYDGSLFLVASDLYVGEVTPDGAVSKFVPRRLIQGNQTNSSITCDPFGWFGGCLFLTDSAGNVSKVTPAGDLYMFVAGLGDGHHYLLFSDGGGFGQHLYIADAAHRRILRVRPQHPVGEPATVWVDFATMGLDIEAVNMAISKDGPFGTDIMYVSDESGRIILLSPGAEHLGDFPSDTLPDSSGPVWIELPRDGSFQDRMIVVAEGSVWQIRPVPAVDLSPVGDPGTDEVVEVDIHADGVLDAFDLSIFLDWFGVDATMPDGTMVAENDEQQEHPGGAPH